MLCYSHHVGIYEEGACFNSWVSERDGDASERKEHPRGPPGTAAPAAPSPSLHVPSPHGGSCPSSPTPAAASGTGCWRCCRCWSHHRIRRQALGARESLTRAISLLFQQRKRYPFLPPPFRFSFFPYIILRLIMIIKYRRSIPSKNL